MTYHGEQFKIILQSAFIGDDGRTMSSPLSSPMRVGILSIKHESNSFVPRETKLSDFRNEYFLVGEAIRDEFAHAHHEVSGFFQGLEAEGIGAVPLLFAYAQPAGVVSGEALAALWEKACETLAGAGHLDGLLVAPHGAAISETHPDMEGWWLGELRNRVGPDLPLVATLDPHANLSPAKVAACDAFVVYRENPHIDQRQRGLEAARLMARMLRGQARPRMAAAYPAVAINIERQLTRAEPMLSVGRKLDEIRAREKVLTAGIVMGYPYADVPEMGSAFVVVTDDDSALAQIIADELAAWLVEHRESFRGELIAPEEALRRAAALPKPVGLLDMGDNSGGGAPTDSTLLAHLCHRDGNLRAFVPLYDPENVEAAWAAGCGAAIHLAMGGKREESPAPPLETDVRVLGLYNGSYTESEPRHGGRTRFEMGRTVVVRTETGLTLMLTSRPAAAYSAGLLAHCQLDPAAFDVLILKGVHAPVAAFEGICGALIRVNTPGVTTADMETLPYRNRRKPLFPFES